MKIILTEKVKWSLVDIISIIFLNIMATIIFFSLFEGIIFFFGFNLSITSRPLVLNFIQAIFLALITIFFLKIRYKTSLKELGFRMENLSKTMKYGLFGGIFISLFIIFINSIFYSFLNNFFGLEVPTQEVVQNLLSSQSNTVFLFYSILIIIVAPIVEEIFFRSLIYIYFKGKFGPIRGMLISGIIFGLAHSSPWLFLSTFLGGVFLAWIYERSSSIYSCIIAHSVWNMIVVGLIYIYWSVG